VGNGGVRRVVPLTFGWEELSQTVSIHGGEPSVRLREPVPGVLLQLDGGWMLLDTGFNVPLLRDPMLHRRFHGRSHGIYPELLADPRDSLEVAFELVGVDPADVVVVALSHLHNDHAGGLRWFVDRVPVHLQKRELEYGLHGGRPGDGPEHHGFIRIDYDDPAVDWKLADGDAELAPGVTAVPTYGHTPGHQSFVVTLAEDAAEAYGVGGFVLAFDAADLQRNIDEELAVGSFIDCEPEETVEAIRRLKSIAAAKGFRVVPGHDPEVWPAFTRELGVPGP
jgi:glyoxylase-like metal-dependent hydrolase (beta-lactamase superfamily II)